jgi:hypothetical protein
MTIRPGRSILLWISFLAFFAGTAFAQVAGKWDSKAVNSCSCHVTLTIKDNQDGSFSGTMSFPGAQAKIYGVTVNGDSVSFLVNQPYDDKSLTYKYSAAVNGDDMTGWWATNDANSTPSPFTAGRMKPPKNPDGP